MRHLLALGAAITVPFAFCAPASPQVSFTDHGPQTAIAGPGAPKHVVGLPRTTHTIGMNTGVKEYGLRYVVAHDEKRPGVAIPGEGYIGMPVPADCNWYGGGFFDLQINGQTLGTTPVHAFGGRSLGERAYVDFVFDTALAVVRVRFVCLVGSDALYCQTLLEPKAEITSLRVALRCYPSAFVSNAERHVLTPTRDLAQGEKAELDPATEGWLLYYDRIFEAGYATSTSRGVGPCAVLWPSSQAGKTTVSVGNYGTDTILDLGPQQRDLRFVFFDFAGTLNDAAKASLRQRAPGLQQELSGFTFTDATVASWPLTRKQQEIKQALAAVPEDKEAAAAYARWATELEAQLPQVRSGAAGAIMAEANAAKTIAAWEEGVPNLKLKLLLRGI
jgi:hypothetical protein